MEESSIAERNNPDSPEVDRLKLLSHLDKTFSEQRVLEEIQSEFTRQIEMLCEGAKKYYHSQQTFRPELLRPYLIAIITDEQALKDYFGKALYVQLQAVFDIAFLREVMFRIKSRLPGLDEVEKYQLVQTSNMKVFREKLNQQEAWTALLKIMK